MSILLFLAPPIVGAFIGYSTNVLAIKMLFRPLREVRLFGIKLPFTPGILPKQRFRLAQSIGNMVERELLTPEVLRQRLACEETRENIKKAISLFTEKLLEKTPNELLKGNEKFLAAAVSDAAEKLYPSLTGMLTDFLNRADIRRELELKGKIFLSKIILKLNIFQRLLLSAGQYDITLEQKMPEIINELISNAENLLRETRVKNIMTTSVSASIEKMLTEQDKKISELFNLSEEGKQKLDNYLFEKLMVSVDGQIENILTSVNIKTLVSQRIDSLDMERVERIILDVMSDQFKWVEIFGGIIGFLIGLFQAGLSWFLR